MRFFRERRELLETAKAMSAQGLSRGTSGNVSVRVDSGFVITPTGMSYAELSTEDLVELHFDGHAPFGQRLPSSEWRLHADLYRLRAEANAIVHAHAMFCTTLSTLRMSIPAVHYMIAVAETDEVRCAPYATFGTAELSRVTIETLGTANACLMANHGMLAVGASLSKALKTAAEIETVAEQYWRALQVGAPHVLPAEEMARVRERFRTYGQQPSRRSRD